MDAFSRGEGRPGVHDSLLSPREAGRNQLGAPIELGKLLRSLVVVLLAHLSELTQQLIAFGRSGGKSLLQLVAFGPRSEDFLTCSADRRVHIVGRDLYVAQQPETEGVTKVPNERERLSES